MVLISCSLTVCLSLFETTKNFVDAGRQVGSMIGQPAPVGSLGFLSFSYAAP